MKKMLRFDMCGSVEVPAGFPVGPLYDTHSRRVGEIVSQLEASDLPELGTVSAVRLVRLHCAVIKQGSMIETINLLRQYVGLDENGNLGIMKFFSIAPKI